MTNGKPLKLCEKKDCGYPDAHVVTILDIMANMRELSKINEKKMMPVIDYAEFQRESNKIEQIYVIKEDEIAALEKFVSKDKINMYDLCNYVEATQPDAKLRSQEGMDVRVGNYYPPPGGEKIPMMVQDLLSKNLDAYYLHIEYEQIHPFTDGNGRSGRALWLWKMKKDKARIYDGFLRTFYYQTLEHFEKKK